MTVISWKARHPERHAQAAARQDQHDAQPETAAKADQRSKRWPKKKRERSGRERKDALMVKAREIAAAGNCAGWNHLLEMMERDGEDAGTLRLWAGGRDIDEIDLICARRRTSERM